jgi:hypothetical protein
MVPAHIQQQFHSIIWVLNRCIGQEATRAYLKSLCTDASLDTLLGESYRSDSPTERRHTSTPSQVEEDTCSPSRQLHEEILASSRETEIRLEGTDS